MANIVPFLVDNDRDATDTKLGSCQASTTSDIIERGRAILARLDSNLKWTDWHDLILALGAGRDLALRIAETDKPRGPKYRKVIGVWLRCYGFDRIDEGDRSRLIACFDHFDEINAWRAKLPAEKQTTLNHPRMALASWKRSLQPAPSDDDQKPPPGPAVHESDDPYAPAALKKLPEVDRKRILVALGFARADAPPAIAAELVQHAVDQERMRVEKLVEDQHKRAVKFIEEVRSVLAVNALAAHQIENIKTALENFDNATTRTLYVRHRLAPESHYRFRDAAKSSTIAVPAPLEPTRPPN